MKYYTIHDYETIKDFIKRIEFSIKGKLYMQEISPILGKGIQVMSVIPESMDEIIKLEVSIYQMDELAEYYQPLSFKPKASRARRTDGLGNIGDLYK